MLLNKIGATLITLALGIASFPCLASVVVSGTRVIYSLAEKEQTVRLTNDGKEPSLVQIWIDDGDVKATPNTAKAPFLVSPPISRIDPSKGQSIRLIYTGEAVPQDIESVYYFNLLEIPPKPSADEVSEQFLQFAFRTRIKLFLRPPDLEGLAEESAEKVMWSVAQRDSGWEVVATNPTPYHVTLIKVELKSVEGAVIASDTVGGMIDPRGTMTFKPKGVAGSSSWWKTLEYRFVNDHGGVTTGEVVAPK
jgi:chaperone protein EcpD